MRGKLQLCNLLLECLGITPAHAGKTFASLPSLGPCQDHPRACGENLSAHRFEDLFEGSPPRMRGKQLKTRRGPFQFRITPAHAGKTLVCPAATTQPEDHPRACGENFYGSSTYTTEEGSPPRMRGKHTLHLHRKTSCRITPAHAGKTAHPWRLPRHGQDHPRACGENMRRGCRGTDAGGSPPRMRGKLK